MFVCVCVQVCGGLPCTIQCTHIFMYMCVWREGKNKEINIVVYLQNPLFICLLLLRGRDPGLRPSVSNLYQQAIKRFHRNQKDVGMAVVDKVHKQGYHYSTLHCPILEVFLKSGSPLAVIHDGRVSPYIVLSLHK